MAKTPLTVLAAASSLMAAVSIYLWIESYVYTDELILPIGGHTHKFETYRGIISYNRWNAQPAQPDTFEFVSFGVTPAVEIRMRRFFQTNFFGFGRDGPALLFPFWPIAVVLLAPSIVWVRRWRLQRKRVIAADRTVK